MTVQNTGRVDGTEGVQVYLSQDEPPVFRPEEASIAFSKVFLKAGEAKQVSFRLNACSCNQ